VEKSRAEPARDRAAAARRREEPIRPDMVLELNGWAVGNGKETQVQIARASKSKEQDARGTEEGHRVEVEGEVRSDMTAGLGL